MAFSRRKNLRASIARRNPSNPATNSKEPCSHERCSKSRAQILGAPARRQSPLRAARRGGDRTGASRALAQFPAHLAAHRRSNRAARPHRPGVRRRANSLRPRIFRAPLLSHRRPRLRRWHRRQRSQRNPRKWRMRTSQQRNAATRRKRSTLFRRHPRHRKRKYRCPGFAKTRQLRGRQSERCQCRGGAPMNALAMLEWNAPAAILCATNLREMGALEMAPILRADPNTAHIPLIAVGGSNAGEQALLEAYRAGCDDFVDRRRSPSDIAAHVRSFLVSRQDGFQPTQMLTSAETDLSGNLQHLDLPGVIQMLGQARQTGALHINAVDADGIIFFEGGEISHAECGMLFGDEAVTQIVATCQGAVKGVYKFVYGATAAQRTVLRSATDLLLDAMREFDESQRDAGEGLPSGTEQLAEQISDLDNVEKKSS